MTQSIWVDRAVKATKVVQQKQKEEQKEGDGKDGSSKATP